MSRTNTAHARKRSQTTTGETVQETAAEAAQREAVAARRKEGVSKRYFKKKEAREALHGPARKPKQPREFHPVWDADTGLRLHKAYTIQVAVDISNGEMLWVCPPVLWRQLGVQTP